jgi:hypothetical protein
VEAPTLRLGRPAPGSVMPLLIHATGMVGGRARIRVATQIDSPFRFFDIPHQAEQGRADSVHA